MSRPIHLFFAPLSRAWLALLIVALSCTFAFSVQPAESQTPGTVPVTVTIERILEIQDPDPALFQGNGDYYARVNLRLDASNLLIQDNYADFIQGPDPDEDPYEIEPGWEFTFDVNPCQFSRFSVIVELWDADPFFAQPDDQMDLVDDPTGTSLTVAKDFSISTLDEGTLPDLTTGEREALPIIQRGDGDPIGGFEGGEAAEVEWTISGGLPDSDKDGIPDLWEESGADTDCDGTVDVPLHTWGADPQHKDLFVEMDWATGNAPPKNEIARLKEAFAKAPIDAGGTPNPDGQPGINLWIDTGNLMEGAELVGDNLGGGNTFVQSGLCDMITDSDADTELDFYEVKDANFDSARAQIFRYGLSAVRCASSPGGQGEQGGNDFVVYTTGENFATTFMHELGHNLDLRHGGFEQDKECKPNYVSVMNYDHRPAILWSDLGQPGGGEFHVDYSPPRYIDAAGVEGRLGPLPDLNENALNEQQALDGNEVINFIFTDANGVKVQQPLSDKPNWNGNALNGEPFYDEPSQQVNIDMPRASTGIPAACSQYDCDDDEQDDCANDNRVLAGHDDWSTISLPFREFTDSADSPGNPPHVSVDPTDVQIAQTLVALNSTDLSIEKSDSDDPAVAGATLTYTVTVRNRGPNRTSEARVVDTLPAGTAFVSASAGCTETGGEVACDLGTLGVGDSASIEITVLVDADLVATNGSSPAVIQNTAIVENIAGDDLNFANDEATEVTQVISEADLSVEKDDDADPANAGDELTYTISTENAGPSVADDVTVVDALPSGTVYVSDTDGCVEAPAGILTCELGDIPAGDAVSFNVTVDVSPSLVYDAGGPVTITNEVIAAAELATDPDGDNNQASEDTQIVASADLEIVSFEAVDPPTEIILGEDVEVTLRKVITNNGPSSPIDALLTRAASAGPGSSVEPTEDEYEALALMLDEERTVDEPFTIRCDEPGLYQFVFNNEIAPLNADDIDPDPGNNAAQTSLVVECLVPVAINILPGGDPNPILTARSGQVPVAVLTTSAGEYGLPYAFDATTIVPASVHFGPAEIVLQGGGASATKERGAIEDSYELDQKTRDGDLDMVLRFKAGDTGLTPGDDEACAYGSWEAPSGAIFKFLGCAPVRMQ